MMANTLSYPFDFGNALEFCRRNDLCLIEDNCDALGCTADNIVGCGTDSGLCFPQFARLATAVNLPFQCCECHAYLDDAIRATLDVAGPAMCEVTLDLRHSFALKLSSRKVNDSRMVPASLEDIDPFLPRDKLAENSLGPRAACFEIFGKNSALS